MIELKEAYGKGCEFNYHISVLGKVTSYDYIEHRENIQKRYGSDLYSLFHGMRWWDFEDNMKEYSTFPENEGIIFKVKLVPDWDHDYFFVYYFYQGTMQKHQLVIPEFVEETII